MHLCNPCKSVDWDARIAQYKTRPPGDGSPRVYCPYCTHIGGARVELVYYTHSMCERCAASKNECQACGASTLSETELGRQDVFETLFDAFVTLVKSYGITSAAQLMREKLASSKDGFSPAEAAVAEKIAAIPLDLVDSMQPHQIYHYRHKRPIWSRVFGQILRDTPPARCANCRRPSRWHPAMTRAARCGHWTAGEAAAWCLPCAVHHGECAFCRASTR